MAITGTGQILNIYRTARDIRSDAQGYYGSGSENDLFRHAHCSALMTREYGSIITRSLGIANEIQGFFWHDIWDLPGRFEGKRGWAFQLSDIYHNEIGIQIEEKLPGWILPLPKNPARK